MRWGLIPHWAKDDKFGAKMINARVETIAQKPSFRNLLSRRHCAAIADGYYEWKVAGKVKIPRPSIHGISIAEWAKTKGTISYEIICSIGNRVERRYID